MGRSPWGCKESGTTERLTHTSYFVLRPSQVGGASGKEPTCQCKRREMWVQSLGREESLEESMTTHSSILPWRIPMDREAGGLQSIGSQRVRHDRSDLALSIQIA